MKKINNAYLFNHKHKNSKDIEEKPLHHMNDYSTIFTALEANKVDKFIKNLFECEEDIYPAMNIPIYFIFELTPMAALVKLGSNINGVQVYNSFITDFLKYVKEWTCYNKVLLMELVSLCPNIKKASLVNNKIEISEFQITPKIEKYYVGKSKNRQDRIKRVKMLAAINAQSVYLSLKKATDDNDTLKAITQMFLFMRSMAQFAANKAVADGLRLQKTRSSGGSKKGDAMGIEMLISQYHVNHPTSSSLDIWKKIKKDLIQKKFISPCKGYRVFFEAEPTDSSDYGGRLIQRKKWQKEYIIEFEAFKRRLYKVRK